MWIPAQKIHDPEIIAMSEALYREDPAERAVPKANTIRTLDELRQNPLRGRVGIYSVNQQIVGYAFLMALWSNELGGEQCLIDEFYVRPEHRGQGYGTKLIEQLRAPFPLWPAQSVSILLEVTPDNLRARTWYAKLGFSPMKNAVMRMRIK